MKILYTILFCTFFVTFYSQTIISKQSNAVNETDSVKIIELAPVNAEPINPFIKDISLAKTKKEIVVSENDNLINEPTQEISITKSAVKLEDAVITVKSESIESKQIQNAKTQKNAIKIIK